MSTISSSTSGYSNSFTSLNANQAQRQTMRDQIKNLGIGDSLETAGADGSTQTITKNQDGSISFDIDLSSDEASRSDSPFSSLVSSLDDSHQQSAAFTLPNGATGQINKKSDGSYEVKFTAQAPADRPPSSASGQHSQSGGSEAGAGSSKHSSQNISGASSTSGSSDTSTTTSTYTLADGTTETVEYNENGTIKDITYKAATASSKISALTANLSTNNEESDTTLAVA